MWLRSRAEASVTEGQCRGEGLTHGRKVARELKGTGLADMGQGEAWIGGDGAVKRRGGTGVDGQQKVDAFDVGIARGCDGGGYGEAVAVRQHVTTPITGIVARSPALGVLLPALPLSASAQGHWFRGNCLARYPLGVSVRQGARAFKVRPLEKAYALIDHL